MPINRIEKLGELLESKNRFLRQEAVEAISLYCFNDDHLYSLLVKCLRSQNWDTRVAASDVFCNVLKRAFDDFIFENGSILNESDLFESVDVGNLVDIQLLLTDYRFLLCDEGENYNLSSDLHSSVLTRKEQRKLVDLHLELDSVAGVSSQSFVSDDEINNPTSHNFFSVDENKLVIGLISDKEVESDAGREEDFLLTMVYKMMGTYLRNFLDDIADQRWYVRHGSALALLKIIGTGGFSWLNCTQFKALSLRLFQVLTLDRFDDFMTGSSAIAPVREIVAQALSGLMLKARKYKAESYVNACIQKICELLRVSEEKQWHCRQTALLVIKYYSSCCEFGADYETELLSLVIRCIDDPALIEANNVIIELHTKIIDEIIEKIWAIMDDNLRMSKLREGVDSIVVEMIQLINFWLRSNSNVSLSLGRLEQLIMLIDSNFPIRTMHLLECVNQALQSSTWNTSNMFLLLKVFYKTLLLLSESYINVIKPLIDTALEVAIRKIVENPSLTLLKQFQPVIGCWISCLLYDNRVIEIDAFNHCIDTYTSQKNHRKVMFCSDEIRFLNEDKRFDVIFQRKLIAGQFIGCILNMLYVSNTIIAEATAVVDSIQQLLISYLKSRSIYQRLGASCIVNGWATAFQRMSIGSFFEKNEVLRIEPPLLLVSELLDGLQHPSNFCYDEAAKAIEHLTSECNEFQNYCLRKGVPRNDLPSLVQSSSDVEDVVRLTFQKCEARLKKVDDKNTLNARYSYISNLVLSTKLIIRTNSQRTSTLLASSALLFGQPISTLTPIIRPIMESLNSESNERVAECLLASFPILISSTTARSPSPHAKIIRQLCSGLNCCFSDSTLTEFASCTVISLKENVKSDSSPKSRNCTFVLERIFAEFGDIVFEVCPDLEKAVSLHTTENFMCNLETLQILLLSSPPLFALKVQVSKVLPAVHTLVSLIGAQDPIIRFRISRFFADLAKINLSWTLLQFYSDIKKKLSNFDSDSDRLGAIEIIFQLSILDDKLIGAVSLIAKLALKTLCDRNEAIREAANAAFRRLIILLPLEKRQMHSIPELSKNSSIAKEYNESFDLVDVLSAPNNLRKIDGSAFPNLRKDVILRPYQLDGITWLTFLHHFRLNGILADDMGLGKTLQILCLLDWEHENDRDCSSPSLIVCPRTLVEHWCLEWNNYFPSKHYRIMKIDDWNQMRSDSIFVVSYEELRNQEKITADHRWNYVVLDEGFTLTPIHNQPILIRFLGHCIRNSNTRLYASVCSLTASHKLILSGTPVQNSAGDLWALFNFLMPGYLSTKVSFNSHYLRKIMACRNPKTSEEQTRDGEEALQSLHKQCLPFVMRRIKSEVLKELPEKIIQDYPCQLTDVQQKLYFSIVSCCTDATQKTESRGNRRISPLHALIALRRLIDHPLMVAELLQKLDIDHFESNLNVSNLITCKLFEEIVKEQYILSNDLYVQMKNKSFETFLSCEFGLKLIAPYVPAFESSGKMLALRELFQECSIGDVSSSDEKLENDELAIPVFSRHRALVFCQWKQTIDIIASYIAQGMFGDNISFLRLDGSTPVGERQGIVNKFNNDKSIDLLLLTTHVFIFKFILLLINVTGLNLTGADTVIFVDHDWNPFKAIDRTHRLGQTKTVNVYRLIASGTVEEKVMSLQKFKNNTAQILVGADNRSLRSMAAEDLIDLLAFGGAKDTSSQTPVAKKQKVHSTEEILSNETWSLEELWDCSAQYEEQNSIMGFVGRIGR